MNRYLKPLVGLILLLALIWGVSSWFLSRQASQAIDDLVENWSQTSAYYVADVELLKIEKGMFSNKKTFHLLPNVPFLVEHLSELSLTVQQKSGPIFFDEGVISFGRAKWFVTIDDGELLNNSDIEPAPTMHLAQANVILGFSEQLSVQGRLEKTNAQPWFSKAATFKGEMDLDSKEYQFITSINELAFSDLGRYLTFPVVDIVVHTQQANTNKEAVSLTKVSLNADNGYLLNGKNGKKSPLNLSSNGSIWENGGTLDVDWKVSFVNTLPLDNKEVHASIQLRRWLTFGVTQYLSRLASSSELLRQAEWALEEVETPEQQDFYHALMYKANEVERLSLSDLIAPMLTGQQSQLSVNAEFRQSTERLVGLRLSANAVTGPESKSRLPLKGELHIARNKLDKDTERFFKRWVNKGWVREYETAFESDISMKMQELLLDNRHMSLVHLNAELKQALIDQ